MSGTWKSALHGVEKKLNERKKVFMNLIYALHHHRPDLILHKTFMFLCEAHTYHRRQWTLYMSEIYCLSLMHFERKLKINLLNFHLSYPPAVVLIQIEIRWCVHQLKSFHDKLNREFIKIYFTSNFSFINF